MGLWAASSRPAPLTESQTMDLTSSDFRNVWPRAVARILKMANEVTGQVDAAIKQAGELHSEIARQRNHFSLVAKDNVARMEAARDAIGIKCDASVTAIAGAGQAAAVSMSRIATESADVLKQRALELVEAAEQHEAAYKLAEARCKAAEEAEALLARHKRDLDVWEREAIARVKAAQAAAPVLDRLTAVFFPPAAVVPAMPARPGGMKKQVVAKKVPA